MSKIARVKYGILGSLLRTPAHMIQTKTLPKMLAHFGEVVSMHDNEYDHFWVGFTAPGDRPNKIKVDHALAPPHSVKYCWIGAETPLGEWARDAKKRFIRSREQKHDVLVDQTEAAADNLAAIFQKADIAVAIGSTKFEDGSKLLQFSKKGSPKKITTTFALVTWEEAGNTTLGQHVGGMFITEQMFAQWMDRTAAAFGSGPLTQKP